jgi:hypothetical protein
MMAGCDRSATPEPGCASCAARDAVIAEQAGAIRELRSDLGALAEEVAELRRRLFTPYRARDGQALPGRGRWRCPGHASEPGTGGR